MVFVEGHYLLALDGTGYFSSMVRYTAKNIGAAGLARACEVQSSYSIGLARPVSMQLETFGTGVTPDAAITALVEQHFDFRLASIMRQFRLRALPTLRQGGFYQQLAAYGHVGRLDMALPWEVTDKVEALQEHTRHL